MAADIYDQHARAFARVEAYAILRDGRPCAKIAIKHPADGAGRLYAYVHWLGLRMERGFANGYGYDKRSAAVSAALEKIARASSVDMADWSVREADALGRFIETRAHMDHQDWQNALRDAEFSVVGAI